MKQTREERDFGEIVDAALLSLIAKGLVRVENVDGKDMFGLTTKGLKKTKHKFCPRCGEPRFKPDRAEIDGKSRPVLKCQSCGYIRELRG